MTSSLIARILPKFTWPSSSDTAPPKSKENKLTSRKLCDHKFLHCFVKQNSWDRSIIIGGLTAGVAGVATLSGFGIVGVVAFALTGTAAGVGIDAISSRRGLHLYSHHFLIEVVEKTKEQLVLRIYEMSKDQNHLDYGVSIQNSKAKGWKIISDYEGLFKKYSETGIYYITNRVYISEQRACKRTKRIFEQKGHVYDATTKNCEHLPTMVFGLNDGKGWSFQTGLTSSYEKLQD